MLNEAAARRGNGFVNRLRMDRDVLADWLSLVFSATLVDRRPASGLALRSTSALKQYGYTYKESSPHASLKSFAHDLKLLPIGRFLAVRAGFARSKRPP
jgi:hypothetical protein